VTNLLTFLSELPVQVVRSGEVLITEGTHPGRLLVLASGAVVVEHDGVAFARIDVPGAVFGEMSAVLERPATATVRAIEDVTVHVVDDPIAFLTNHPGAALTVLQTTASRLDGLTRYLVDVKRQFADVSGHVGLVDQILDVLVHHQGPAAATGSARDPEGDHHHDDDLTTGPDPESGDAQRL
jgi:CRP-like cAMP-binding protein